VSIPEAAPRRTRTATESLLAVALGLEAAVMFFVTLTVYGLRVLEPLPAFIGGGVFIVLLVVAARLTRSRAGVMFGWVLQLALIATGILLPVLYVVGLGFTGIWIFCLVKGRQLDRARDAALAAGPDTP
jgi:hypothetical protein